VDSADGAFAGFSGESRPDRLPDDLSDAGPAQSHSWRGRALIGRGEFAEAANALEQATTLEPADATGYCNLGVARLKLGKLDAAADAFRHAIALKPDLAEAHSNLGVVLVKQGKTGDAVTAFRSAVALRSDWAEAYANLASALQQQGDTEGATDALRRVVALRRDDPGAHSNFGLGLLREENFEEAAAAFRQAVALKPELFEAYSNLGIAYARQGDLDGAIGAFETALGLRGDLPEAHANLGHVLHQLGNVDGSIAAYRKAIAFKPDYAMAHFGLSVALLAKGEYEEGWREYEWRWLGCGTKPPESPRPRWTGEDVVGETVLVCGEQGLGDTLQFARYIPLLARRGARVVVAAAPPLVALFRRLDGAAAVCGPGEPLPWFDHFCPMMSLPLIFGTRVDNIPAAIPYLSADPDKAAAWRQRLAAALPGLRVGLVWAGSPRKEHPVARLVDRRRSMTLGHFAALADLPGVSFVSLQKGEPAMQTRSPPPGFELCDWTEDLEDFDDTAALIEALDLVISVDTAVAHLAGALGKPVWLLNRFDSCWRWLIERDDSPWYPTLRQFRQRRPGDWDEVINRVGAALSEFGSRC
jgi:Flp pilus assembly protein TadD